MPPAAALTTRSLVLGGESPQREPLVPRRGHRPRHGHGHWCWLGHRHRHWHRRGMTSFASHARGGPRGWLLLLLRPDRKKGGGQGGHGGWTGREAGGEKGETRGEERQYHLMTGRTWWPRTQASRKVTSRAASAVHRLERKSCVPAITSTRMRALFIVLWIAPTGWWIVVVLSRTESTQSEHYIILYRYVNFPSSPASAH